MKTQQTGNPWSKPATNSPGGMFDNHLPEKQNGHSATIAFCHNEKMINSAKVNRRV